MARASAEITDRRGRLRPASSIEGDISHGPARTPAYEWWYFDALSHDGRDALVVIYLSNFVFSPRYNRTAAESLRHSQSANTSASFPAVAVCFYRDGRPLFRAINEYAPDDFQASTTEPLCRIGRNSFRLVETLSATRYELNVDTRLRRNRRLEARLEWAIEEGDFFEEEKEVAPREAAHYWNMVAPRCEVSGRISLTEGNGARSFEQDFSGTGYHDHNRDTRWMPETIAEWQWGRFHFPDATAVFYRYRERDESLPQTRLYLIEGNSLSIREPQLTARSIRQHFFGLRYPRLLLFQAPTAEGSSMTLSLRQQRVIDGSFFYLRFLSEATLERADGRRQKAAGITEHLAPRSLGYSWLWWLINMRIGRQGRGAFLP